MAFSNNVLERFKAKRSNWLSAFDLKSTNSVAAQLCSLTFDVTAYEIFQECVRLSDVAPDGGKQLNGTIFNLLSRCFAKSFMSEVRKLADSTRGTRSLVKLLEDMQSSHELFTRELILAGEGIAYDWTDLEAQEQATVHEQLVQGNTFTLGPDFIGSADQSKERHTQIDRLCHVTPANRKPTDKVSRRLFSSLIDEIRTASSKVTDYTNDFVAHAASEERISKYPERSISMEDLRNAHETLCKVAGFVSLHILGDAQYSFFVQPSGNPLMYANRPLVNLQHAHIFEAKLKELDANFHDFSEWYP